MHVGKQVWRELWNDSAYRGWRLWKEKWTHP
jgi:hypothetical protein